MTTTAPPIAPPAVIATMRAAAEDALAEHMVCVGDAAIDVTEANLSGLEREGWEIRRRRRVPAVPLTEYQRETLLMVAAGASNADMRARWFVSQDAVKSRVKSLYRVLGAGSQVEAVLLAVALGYASADELLADKPADVGAVR